MMCPGGVFTDTYRTWPLTLSALLTDARLLRRCFSTSIRLTRPSLPCHSQGFHLFVGDVAELVHHRINTLALPFSQDNRGAV